jgi:hypothetical protein
MCLLGPLITTELKYLWAICTRPPINREKRHTVCVRESMVMKGDYQVALNLSRVLRANKAAALVRTRRARTST